MDPWLEGSNDAVLQWMKDSFLSHCTLFSLTFFHDESSG